MPHLSVTPNNTANLFAGCTAFAAAHFSGAKVGGQCGARTEVGALPTQGGLGPNLMVSGFER